MGAPNPTTIATSFPHPRAAVPQGVASVVGMGHPPHTITTPLLALVVPSRELRPSFGMGKSNPHPSQHQAGFPTCWWCLKELGVRRRMGGKTIRTRVDGKMAFTLHDFEMGHFLRRADVLLEEMSAEGGYCAKYIDIMTS
ncbi:hypothetical protein AVEN_231820-1 [Araneus ventricosus]|uniref:Uncharacterized protein n=1 Tax=Araneus ventricosus TaxID=182803 RepID=A0A4Y2WE96_ARAVE|nr:hypothetical protein AVEN_231820-1 [Araneus ventricosus]